MGNRTMVVVAVQGAPEFGVLQYGFGFLVYVSLLLKFTILIAICKLHLGCCLG